MNRGSTGWGAAANPAPLIRLTNVSLSYPRPWGYRELLKPPWIARERVLVLDKIDASVDRGERLAVVGHNGAGKTTLLKLVGGLLYPSQGTVTVEGFDTVIANDRVRQRMSVVVNEERSFYWRLTGWQNLAFFAALENLRGAALKARLQSVMIEVGLWSSAHKRVSDYSAGMRQRLALARALVPDPEILLLDEPTKSLDAVGAEAARLLVGGGDSGRRRTLIMATNQLADIPGLCDRIWFVKDRRVIDVQGLRGITQSELTELYRSLVQGVSTSGVRAASG